MYAHLGPSSLSAGGRAIHVPIGASCGGAAAPVLSWPAEQLPPSERMLAEVFEAVLGAVWEDLGHSFDAVSAVYHRVAGQ
ncbi:hypothetical protein COHA_006533 [Chlorella ohadii]|uniref:RNase III domain-containing protein n=1 Tax=Chlorella ohadii TaxID=2649997 RepID=A0AAD5DSN8_9CHLO|nr:hypothetical protein COHA_006533 [Chlorella ohadii]